MRRPTMPRVLRGLLSLAPLLLLAYLTSTDAVARVLTPAAGRVLMWLVCLVGVALCCAIVWAMLRACRRGDREDAKFLAAGLVAFGAATLGLIDVQAMPYALPPNLPTDSTPRGRVYGDVLGVCGGVFFIVGIGVIVAGRNRLRGSWARLRQLRPRR